MGGPPVLCMPWLFLFVFVCRVESCFCGPNSARQRLPGAPPGRQGIPLLSSKRGGGDQSVLGRPNGLFAPLERQGEFRSAYTDVLLLVPHFVPQILQYNNQCSVLVLTRDTGSGGCRAALLCCEVCSLC